jgi:catechol 2,3-dioxygenase-like lactoylglutathione lyase family enzyme
MAAPIRVRQIDHVTLVVRDLERSRWFYVDVLGMQPVDRPAFSFEGLWFQAGATQVHLIAEHADSGPAGVHLPRGGQISRGGHFAFEVENALAARDRLQELGLALASGPKQRPDGPTQIYVLDPDSHLVELFSK